MKKFRGKKRYFHNMRRASVVDQYNLNFEQSGWFDLWHTHLDFHGIGNHSLKWRREHVKAHLALYNNLLEKLQSYDKPYQSWVQLVDKYAEYDAVFIHTPNPNEDNFPLKLDNIAWNCSVPLYLKDLINLDEFNIGHYENDSSVNYIIQSKNKNIEL